MTTFEKALLPVREDQQPGKLLLTYGQIPFVFVPAGRPEQMSDLVTKPSAMTVEAIFVLSTATGVSRIEGILPPSIVIVVLPLVIEEVSVPLLIAPTSIAVAVASLVMAL